MAEISVIVPIYKVEQYLDRCVESILAQSIEDFELILVDDGSPDRCPEMCDEWAKKDSRIVVIHKENGGLSDARNTGIDWVFANSDSEWITFIDSDDWVHPRYLECLYNAVLNHNVDVSSCSFCNTSGEIPQEPIDDFFQLLTPEDFYVEHNTNFVIACGKLYKKKCFDTIRYPVGKLHEDEFTTYKIIFDKDYIAVTFQKLYYYYQNPDGIMNSKWNMRRLDALEALSGQIVFFEEKQFELALKLSVQSLLNSIFKAYKNVEELSLDKTSKNLESTKKRLQKQLRFYVMKYGDIADIHFNTHVYYYELMYPRFMTVYWYFKAFINKAKGLFDK